MTIAEIVAAQPALFMIAISFLIALAISLVYKYMSNQSEMKRLKGELKELQKSIKENKGKPEKLTEIQKQLAEKNITYMKHSFKPMLFTFVPAILILVWLKNLYNGIDIILTLPFGLGLNWIWTYVIFSFVFSLILRKFLHIY